MELPDLEPMSVQALVELHAQMDDEIRVIREKQGLVDAVIHAKEIAAMVPGPVHLTQTLGHMAVKIGE
jgi:hypothetical protein